MVKTREEVLRVLGAKYDKLLAGPQNVFADITNFCNFSCVSCWIHSPVIKNESAAKFMDFKTFQEIIKEAKKWKSQTISVSGDGEPFLHPDIKQMIECMRENGLRISITTNLSFKRSLVSHLKDVDILYAHIDAITERLYKKIHCARGQNFYDRVFENLKSASDLSLKTGKPKIYIVHLVHKLNYKHIRKNLDLLKKFNISKMFIEPMESIDQTELFSLSKSQIKEFKGIIEGIIRGDSAGDIKRRTNMEELYQYLADPKESAYNLKQCFSGWFNILVDFYGNVFLCCHNDRTKVGNIHDDSLFKIFNSERAKKMRLKLKYGFDLKNPMFKEQCQQCWWFRDNQQIAKIIGQLNKKNISAAEKAHAFQEIYF